MRCVNPRRLIFVLALTLAGCGGNNYESLRKQQVDTVNEALQVLGEVRDAPSAAKARPRLKALGEKWRDLDARMGRLPVAADEEARSKALTDQLDGLILRY